MILPPDTSSTVGQESISIPFYQDPPSQPGMHRDLFQSWAHKLLGELTLANFSFTAMACRHLPAEYMSDSEVVEESDGRSCSSWGDVAAGGSEEPIARRPSMLDSSDEEGAHRPQVLDSSDEEGAHLPAASGVGRGRR